MEPAADVIDSASAEEVSRELLRNAVYEIMPLRSIGAAIGALPSGARVDITRSPVKPLREALDAACVLARAQPAMRVVPHIAARVVADRSQLMVLTTMLTTSGVDTVFVIAGDRTDESGEYSSGLELIEDLRAYVPAVTTIGIPGYPDGHPFISDEVLRDQLIEKSRYASYVTTQMCFDGPKIIDWIRQLRSWGVELPVYIGIPGVFSRIKLLRIAMQIGVGASVRFLRKNIDTAAGLVGTRKYSPSHLVRDVCQQIALQRVSGVAGFHINTFNQVAATRAWLDGVASRPRTP